MRATTRTKTEAEVLAKLALKNMTVATQDGGICANCGHTILEGETIKLDGTHASRATCGLNISGALLRG